MVTGSFLDFLLQVSDSLVLHRFLSMPRDNSIRVIKIISGGLKEIEGNRNNDVSYDQLE